MAKREMSTTLRNLKFMQRSSLPKVDPKPPIAEEKEEQELPKDESFGASPDVPKKKCIVIMEGNPHPGAVKGRMSFRSFNPSIDKLHQEATTIHQDPVANTNHRNGGSERSGNQDVDGTSKDPNIDLKRKQPETEMETPPSNKSQKTGETSGQSASESSSRSSEKQQKRDKLDWNVLRPPKPDSRRK